MPIFEYRCGKCSKEFEKVVFTSTDTVECPQCQGTEVKKLMSACAFSVSGNFRSSVGSSCGSCTPSPAGCSSCGTRH